MSSAHDPSRVPRDEAEAALAARRELGPEYEPAIVDSFVDRVDKAIDARVAEHLADRAGPGFSQPDRNGVLALSIVSLGCGIPITAIAGGTADLPGILVAWCGIAAVNLSYAFSSRPRRADPPSRRR
jgi:hypothetical protein